MKVKWEVFNPSGYDNMRSAFTEAGRIEVVQEFYTGDWYMGCNALGFYNHKLRAKTDVGAMRETIRLLIAQVNRKHALLMKDLNDLLS